MRDSHIQSTETTDIPSPIALLTTASPGYFWCVDEQTTTVLAAEPVGHTLVEKVGECEMCVRVQVSIHWNCRIVWNKETTFLGV